jgi:cation:H+ antiporter
MDGLTLFIGFILYIALVIYYARKSSNGRSEEETATDSTLNPGIILALLLVGIIGLRYGAAWVVESAVEMSQRLGVPELILALTVVAVGTSLPELATSLVAAFKREGDISIGNILGSNLFNMMAIAGPTAIANPLPVAGEVIRYHLPIMVGLTAILFPLLWSGRQVGRIEGGVLLASYVAIFTWWAL